MSDTLMLTPTRDAMATAAAWLSAFCERGDFSPSQSMRVNLVLEEALTNVVQYSFCSPPANGAAYVRLQLALEEGRVVLQVTDNGTAFDPTAMRLADKADNVESAEPGGHGIRLMRHYTQRMVYRRVDDTNDLTLTLA